MGTTNNKPPGPIVMIAQSKTGSSSQIMLITLLSSSYTPSLRFIPASANWANTIFLRWTGICWRFLEDLRPLDEEKSTYATISFWILFPTSKLVEVRNSVLLNFLKNQTFYTNSPNLFWMIGTPMNHCYTNLDHKLGYSSKIVTNIIRIRKRSERMGCRGEWRGVEN